MAVERSRLRAAAVVAAVALAAAGGWWLGRQDGAAPDAAPRAEQAARSDSGVAADDPAAARAAAERASARGRSAAAGTLPPLSMPLRDAYPELKRLADAGEPRAACRLASELARCNALRERLDGIDAALAAMQQATLPPDKQAAERQQRALAQQQSRLVAQSEALLRDAEQCDGVPAATPAMLTAYWRNAALSGHLPSLTHYAVGNAFRWENLLQNLPALTRYRAEAERLARQAAQAGDARALAALAAYAPVRRSPRRPFLAQIVQPDGVEALALYLQLEAAQPQAAERSPQRDALARQIRTLEQQLDAGQRAEAQRRAAARAASWRTPDPAQANPVAIAYGAVGDVQPAECMGEAP